jgi:amino acid adenylation domain-containing protein
VGAAFDGRRLPELQTALGLFARYLPVTSHLEEELQFSELIKQLDKAVLTVRDRQEYFSWDKLIEPSVLTLRQPFFPFCFESEKPTADFLEGDVSFTLVRQYACIDRFGIKLTCARRPQGLVIEFHYNTRLFRLADIASLIGQFHALLENVLANPTAKVRDLEMISEGERHRLFTEYNSTKTELPPGKFAHKLFSEQAERTPEAVAVIYEGQHFTYRELNERANQLAHYLRRSGVGPEVIVGICLQRSLELIVGLLAILKSGGAYLPLDPSYPQARLAFILEDAAVKRVLTRTQLRSRLPRIENLQLMDVDALWDLISQYPAEEFEPILFPDNLAYVIYTSGSTGRPKGVMLRHGSLQNYLLWAMSYYPLDAGRGAPVHSSLNFDLTITSLFTPLLVGGCVHLLSNENEIEALGVALSERHEYSLVKLTPAHLQILAEQLSAIDLNGVTRSFVIGGENLPTKTVMWWRDRAAAIRLFNEYGPTECLVGCSIYEIGANEEVEKGRAAVPIGRPIANTSIYILDGRRRPTALGVIGELCVGGEGLARGYLNRPDLTAERFIPHPYATETGARLYRTGDLARYLREGNIECLGRIDEQVKLRGYRVELGEIEAVLNEHRSVKQSVAITNENESGDKRLIGYVVCEKGVTAAELKKHVRERLPDYMAPNEILILTEMPVTTNGKIDRKRLPLVKATGRKIEQEYVGARTPLEEIVADIFEEVLRLDRVGIHDNFFEIGGHSLLATQVVSRVRSVFRAEIGVRSIFEQPTVEGVARRIEEVMNVGEKTEMPPFVRASKKGQKGERLPLSFAQQRLWFIDQLEPAGAYNCPGAVMMTGKLNLEALERGINEIVRRHEVLRTRFEAEDGEPAQIIDEWTPQRLEVEDLTNLTEQERMEEARRRAKEEAMTGFDLSKGLLVRVKVLKLGEDKHVLLFTMHHIVSDGWSLGILTREIGELYQVYSAGKESPLEELPFQYVDFAVWQEEWMKGAGLEEQMRYWKDHLAGVSITTVPTDRPRPSASAARGDERSVMFPEDLIDALKALSRKEGVTLFMTLVAAFQTLLRYYIHQDDIVVGTDVANRNRAEIEGLIGFFVNLLVMRTDLSNDPTFRDLLKRVRDVALNAYAHQDVPFDKLVEVLNPERSPGHTPLFQVKIVLQNAPSYELELSGLTLTPFNLDYYSVKNDLLLNMTEVNGGLSATLMYNDDLYEAKTIEQILNNFGIILRVVVKQPDIHLSELDEHLVEAKRQQQLLERQEFKAARRKLREIAKTRY